ncbi:MAG: hypothetical protein MUF18_21240 [Fimbriiglobus sp.]|nr:hypothetical protein [Fimbriiglobus sp.]
MTLVMLTPVVFLLVIGVAWALDSIFRTVEHFRMRWVRCPKCEAKDWSKGFTRGFGL